jgi:DNA mismatch endonuclease (patch repair protein)
MDIFSREKRSEVMSRVRSKDTRPELVVRRSLHRRGLRFRLHRRDLPGQPDIVFTSRRVVVFIHGCFWHRHPGCRRATMPASRMEFWKAKFDATVKRDAETLCMLEAAGWTVLVIWECEIGPDALEALYQQIIAEPVR